ncbi:MAG TPA: hypothetical protein VI110_03555 [Lapillicoccus sp.]
MSTRPTPLQAIPSHGSRPSGSQPDALVATDVVKTYGPLAPGEVARSRLRRLVLTEHADDVPRLGEGTAGGPADRR